MSTAVARSLLLLGCAVWALLTVAPAQGQAPPDIVVLRDGTMFRGTLVERGSDRVVIVLPTGEVRTFTGSEVERAGRDASGEPAMVQGPPMSEAAPTIRLHVTGASPRLALEVLESTSQTPDPIVFGIDGRERVAIGIGAGGSESCRIVHGPGGWERVPAPDEERCASGQLDRFPPDTWRGRITRRCCAR